MKTFSQEVNVNGAEYTIQYTRDDAEYEPPEPRSWNYPGCSANATLYSGTLENGEPAPEWLINAFNLSADNINGIIEDLENEMRDDAIDAAEYRAESILEAKWEAYR